MTTLGASSCFYIPEFQIPGFWGSPVSLAGRGVIIPDGVNGRGILAVNLLKLNLPARAANRGVFGLDDGVFRSIEVKMFEKLAIPRSPGGLRQAAEVPEIRGTASFWTGERLTHRKKGRVRTIVAPGLY